MRFVFTGTLNFNPIESKVPWIRSGKTKHGAKYETINAVVVNGNSRGYVELFGAEQDVIKTIDSKNQKIDVNWEDRNDKEVVDNVANYRKHVVNIDNRMEFIADYDAVEYLKDRKNDMAGMRVTISGPVTKNYLNGSVSNRFQIQNVYKANDNVKDRLMVEGEIFYRDEDIDLSEWKDEKKIYINAFTREYVRDVNGMRYVPQQFIFDASKVDFNDAELAKRVSYIVGQLGIKYLAGELKVALKKNTVYHQSVICNYVNGAEKIEFSADTLTPNQKEALELGIKTLDDFRPRGEIYGSRVTCLKIVNFTMSSGFEDGVAEADIEPDDFESEIFHVETTANEMAEVETTPASKTDDDDLFG